MSDTPRTDEAVKQILQVSRPERVSAEFAREFERQVNHLLVEITQLQSQQRAS
jgi:hypothetical protein